MIMWGSTRAAMVATRRAIILAGLLLNEEDILTNLEKSAAVGREERIMEKRRTGNRECRREEFRTLGKRSPTLTMKTQTERRKSNSTMREAAVADVMC